MVGTKSKIVLTGIISLLFIGIVIILACVYLYPVWMQRTTPQACATITTQNAIDVVTRDFMENRLPNWGNDKDDLGTQTPALAFITDNVKADNGTYRVPFSAKGPAATLRYIGNLNCSNNYIKYQSLD
ncbi:colicin M resistance protein [Rahnella sp. SAP-1]|jgi:hypothetical protein|uniref:Colicin M resistance protein n=1 Tax=Rouxiella aceris TaxID=2703884 RepID=A0A848MEW3_9GAMM|nr:YebF family protein [Rouxiella aceris]NMP26808.1 colicin M resistance protein [Rouxiella aceris]